jgi:tRNA modification GTPase
MENQQSQNWMNEFRDQVKEMSKQLWKLVESTRKGMLIRSGICVALIGRTNVGKSSILNKLASRDVAIVSNIPGTTRDSLEVRLSLANIPVTVTDTAGLRQTTDELEREGISRSINRLV